MRIAVYDGVDGTGNLVDSGAVVFVTEDPFSISAYVPPYLTFCTGVTVAPDCSSAQGALVDFGEFSSSSATTATTQFSAATNSLFGYNVFMQGFTMTSGNNVISPLTSTSSSGPGQPQFGFNLRANTSPSVGSNTTGNGSGSPASNYGSPNNFRFVSGERIAGTPTPSDF